MQLPYWLLTFEELVEVLIGDPQERKAEVEILQELIPIAKARYGAGRGNARETGLRRAAADSQVHRRHAGPLPHLRPDPDSSTSAWASSRTSGTCRPTAT